MSLACQPTLEYAGSAVKPGAGTGTTMLLISFVLSASRSSPLVPVTAVTAVTVTRRVMVVPEFVMNALEPLITHMPLSRWAVVRVPPASLPAAGSVRPNAPRAVPEHSIGSHSRFCFSVPNR